MSEENEKLEEARRLWDNAIEAVGKLRHVDKATLREIAKTRTRMPVIVFGQKGRTQENITSAAYTKGLGLGSDLPVKADLPKGGLKAYLLVYIDRVSMLQAGTVPERQISKYDNYEDGGWRQDCYDIQWQQNQDALKLPPLSHETLPQWAEQISRDMIQDAQHYGDFEVENIGGKVQHFSTGYPIEVEKQIFKNYNKLLGRKIRRAEEKAKSTARNSRIKGLEDRWEGYFINEAKRKTFLMDFEVGSTREAVGDVLNSIVTASP